MSNKEAIELVRELYKRYDKVVQAVNQIWPGEGDSGYYGQMKTATELAISAMEKREPMAIKDADICCDDYYCPSCGSENYCEQYEVTHNFCPVCGQALIKRKKRNVAL